MTLRPLILASMTVLLLGTVGCATRVMRPEPSTRSTPPSASSASAALRLLEWCYNNRSIDDYREIFTDDFRFHFSPLDSAGNDYHTIPWTITDELIHAAHLFVGGAAEAPASSITLNLDRYPVVLPDSRYLTTDPVGRWHKRITTQVVLDIRTTDGNAIAISGQALFYFVRGDSALIPPELRDRGIGPDSTRWYVQRWDDETVQDAGGWVVQALRPAPRLAAQPTSSRSWGSVKVLYR